MKEKFFPELNCVKIWRVVNGKYYKYHTSVQRQKRVTCLYD